MKNDFLPICHKDMINRGWDSVDFIIVTGDAYVDHPAFGTAIISRVLESEGYKVGIISQPDWHNNKSFLEFGIPKYGIFINSGNIDSMVAHYTVAKKKRTEDYYSPGGKIGKRPDHAVVVYCNKCREIFGKIPIVIGGLEASLRRFAHYDYWQDSVRASILCDSGADFLVYGMGEKQTIEIADCLSNKQIDKIKNIRGLCYLDTVVPENATILPSYEKVSKNKVDYAVAARIELEEHDFVSGHVLVQKHGDTYLIQNKPMTPLNTEELDKVYSLGYMRNYHPSYEKFGGVPAIKEVKFSIIHNRGCFGSCNFCSLAFHQGRYITSRSIDSIVKEAEELTKYPDFKGYIHDVGGPTANFRFPSCEKQKKSGHCYNKKCLAPTPCKNLVVDHSEYLNILRKLRSIEGVKRVYIRSGIRFDYLMEDKSDEFFKELVKYHVSGQLKVAPEHCSATVLDKMGKPHIDSYIKFRKKYYELCKKADLEQYLVPYLMSSHPGCTIKDAVELALFIKKEKLHPKQVQDFYPTPGTISTAMYYTGLDPYTLKEVYIPKPEEKPLQRALMQYFIPENKEKVIKALKIAGREDLIGYNSNCLVKGSVNITAKNINKKNNNIKKTRVKSHKWEPNSKRK